MSGSGIKKAGRDSSIELFRIITMFCIVAHHYVVNSGLTEEFAVNVTVEDRTLFALLFGWGGKTGINCFVLITGYFMCTSHITFKKFLKLFLEIQFYRIIIYFIFVQTGYTEISLEGLLDAFLPVYSIWGGFIGSYLVFYVFIPFLNLFIRAINEKQHQMLIGLCLLVGTVPQTFMNAGSVFTYPCWFMVLYFIASYIRIYPKDIFNNRKLWGRAALAILVLSWASVVAGAYLQQIGSTLSCYHLVSDSNKLLAVSTAVCAFLYFKNLKMKTHPIINIIASSCFGVLLIHANSDVMRQWLWGDLLKVVQAYHGRYFPCHAVLSVTGVFVVCTVIDQVRIYLVEKPFFRWYDRICKKRAGEGCGTEA